MDSDQKILQLCHKVISTPDSDGELEPALQELKAELHQHLNRARERVNELAAVTEFENLSKVA